MLKKHYYLSILFLLYAPTLLADCVGSGIELWPRNESLVQHPTLMIEGYAASQAIITALNQEHPIYLQSAQHKVPLKIIEVLQGKYELTQALLQPKEALKIGQTYQLVIENMPDWHSPIQRWSQALQRDAPVQWTVSRKVDQTAPGFTKIPREIKKVFFPLGCGPEIYVVFKGSVKEESEYLVKTTVTHLETQQSSTYYLEARAGEIQVGHGMCAGAFQLVDGQHYAVSFSLLDAAGNSNQPSQPQPFLPPKAPRLELYQKED